MVIKIIPERQELDERCYRRWDAMMAAGALNEAVALGERELDESLPAMKAPRRAGIDRFCQRTLFVGRGFGSGKTAYQAVCQAPSDVV